MKIEKIIGANLTYYMTINHENQVELARAINGTSQAISKWVNAQTLPRADYLLSIAKHYGISVEELCTLNYRLNPCPFCGAEMTIKKGDVGFSVEGKHDLECFFVNYNEIPVYVSEETLCTAWNRRGKE